MDKIYVAVVVILIYFTSANYDKVVKKFKGLEQHSSVSDSEPEQKRRCIPANRFSDYVLDCSSESDTDAPPTPKLRNYTLSTEKLTGTIFCFKLV